MSKLKSCVRAVSLLKQLSSMLTVEQQLGWEATILLDEKLASAKINDRLNLLLSSRPLYRYMGRLRHQCHII